MHVDSNAPLVCVKASLLVSARVYDHHHVFKRHTRLSDVCRQHDLAHPGGRYLQQQPADMTNNVQLQSQEQQSKHNDTRPTSGTNQHKYDAQSGP